MSILALKKVTLCGVLREKTELLSELQTLGCLHLEPLRPAPPEPEKAASPRAEEAYKALKFLSDMPNRRKQVRRDQSFDVAEVVQQARRLQDSLLETQDRRDFLADRIKQVEPWGDLVFPPHADLDGYHLWFYMLPAGKHKALETLEIPWQIMHRDPRRIYLVLLAKDEPPSDILPVERTHTGALPLSELKERLEEAEVEIETLMGERQALTRFIYLLTANLAKAEDAAVLTYAAEQTRDDEAIFAVQGWVPVPALADVSALADGHGLACLIEEPGPDDKPPTLLDNPPELGAATDLALFYQTPGYRTWDPGIVVLFSFALFFAMILSDAGYALVLLALIAASWKKLSRSATGRRYRNFGLIVSGAALFYGILAGGYFGVTPPPGSLLDIFHVIDINDFASMMTMSIMIGALHLILANSIAAFLNRRNPIAIAKLGWIAVILGGLAIWLAGAGSAFGIIGTLFLIGGLALVFVFSSQRRVETPKDYLFRGLDGLLALTKITGIFGDVLSYMRLFALGLSSASLALTFNQLAVQVGEAMPGIGFFLGLLILLLGHTMNLGLSVMSGVVHGLRLNFMEFFNWGMSEEGYSFKAFTRKEVQS